MRLVVPTFHLFFICFRAANCKFTEGELKTSDDWAFLARFCFLSEQGEYEYQIEYDDSQGQLNLLLYYDTEDQWPSVYKTNKTCQQKEAVLHVEQNQIINLTSNYPFKELSGCYYRTLPPAVTTTTKPQTRFPPARRRTHSQRRSTSTSTTTEQITTADVANFTYDELSEFTDGSTHDVNQDFEVLENFTAMQRVVPTKAPIKKRNADGYRRETVCHNSRRFRSSRERWWFFAVSNCNATRGIHLRYRILMTNGPPEDYWHRHFSADEFYILPVQMAFTLAYSFLMLAIVMCSVELKSRQLLHSTYKLFVTSAAIQLFGILLQSMAYLKYAVNGVGFPTLRVAGAVFLAASETCFLLLLLLLAKGYTVTRGRLPLAASIKLTVFMCLYVVTYASLFIYEAKIFDPGEVLYLYESPAGYGLIVLRVCAWAMFIYSTVFTLKHYPEKSNFYYPFNIFGTLWFVAGPAFILSANTYIDKWVRESVVCAVLLFIAFGGHLMFLLLTMPSVANKNFPYHVRTSQIGIMEVTGSAGCNTMEQFGHHVYEPSAAVTETVIIPLTRRTEEIFETMYAQRLNSSMRIARTSLQPQERDAAMENVLSWSLAKNLPAIADASINRNRLGSGESRTTESGQEDDFNFASAPRESPKYSFNDYVREVPVELFTVSKMVVSTGSVKMEDNSRS